MASMRSVGHSVRFGADNDIADINSFKIFAGGRRPVNNRYGAFRYEPEVLIRSESPASPGQVVETFMNENSGCRLFALLTIKWLRRR